VSRWRDLKSPGNRAAPYSEAVPEPAPHTPQPAPRRPALFLDRDGVLNEDHGYVSRWEDFRWIPGAREAVAAFNRAGWLVIVVTNQSGVGRGYYTEDAMHALHARMAQDLAEVGGRIDAVYHAPQHPEAPVGAYRHPDPPDRKPNPGMILRALSDWPIDREASLLIGDKPSDLEAAERAGIRGVLFEGGDLKQFLADQALLPN
jgi:D-glycero-D-manno-heptose 1,7-bisphosphate phosphatase